MSPYAQSQDQSLPSSTPQLQSMTFSPPSPQIETPQIEYESDQDEIEELLDTSLRHKTPSELYDTGTLTSNDIESDPILSKFALKQSSSNTAFKAKPVPSTSKSGAGPLIRMNKSAALRAGLNWDEIKPKRVVGEGGDSKGEEGERVGLGISIPSLATPNITPRQTKSSQLRTRPDPSVEIKNHHRTSSVPILNNLSKPTILPRQNRTSALRAAGEKGNGGYRDYEKIQKEKELQKLKDQIALENKEKTKLETIERRKTLSLELNLTCFSKPIIQVKQNKTSNLRAIGEKGNEGYRNYDKIQEELKAKLSKEQAAIENKEKAKKEREERRKTFNLNSDLISLNKPNLEVKQNKTSALRAAGEKGNEGYRAYDKIQEEKQVKLAMEKVASENKEKGIKEREERRKSLAVPRSLSRPSITPKTNKTSMLRTQSQRSVTSLSSLKSPGLSTQTHTPSNTSHSLTRTMSALQVSSVDNISDAPVSKPEGSKKGFTTVVKSLGTPIITPRLNRTAMLRAPNTARAANKPYSRPTLPASSSTPSIRRTITSTSTPSLKSNVTSSSMPRTAPSPAITPRPTKASLLRANLGEKVSSS